jgi:hypothetical protein
VKPEPYQAPSPDSRACFVLRPLVLLLAALAAILLPVALGAPALGAQNRAGAFNPPDVTFAGTPSVESPCSRRDSNAPGGRIAVGCFVGDEDAAAADLAEDGTAIIGEEAPSVAYSSPVGRSGNPIEIEPGTNEPGEISGRPYSGHAFDRMQGRGIPPSAVEDAIANGETRAGGSGATVYSGENGVTVVVGGDGTVETTW